MKDTEFLKNNLISIRGIYDNKKIFENTLPAFSLAMQRGFIIHLTVHTTKDGFLVIYHDHDLTRMTNLKDQIETLTYEELNYLSSYQIPQLEEVLKLIKGKVPIIINPRTHTNKYLLEKELVKHLDEYQGDFAILNEHASIIKWFNKHRPDYIVGEILQKNFRFGRRTIRDLLAHYSIITQFKSVSISSYSVPKIKSLMMNDMVLGYIADSQEKYEKFKDVCDNLFIDDIREIEI